MPKNKFAHGPDDDSEIIELGGGIEGSPNGIDQA